MKKLVLLACASLPLSVLADGGLPDKPYIYVEGKAEIEKAADMVTLRFDLVARNPDQNKANQEVQAKANKIFALLNERKITENDVIASDLQSEPQYEEKESGRGRAKLSATPSLDLFQSRSEMFQPSPKWWMNCSRSAAPSSQESIPG